MAFKYTDYDDINRLADVLINAGHEDQAASSIDNIFAAGEYDSALSMLLGFIETNGLKIPKDIFEELVVDYAPESDDWDLVMYEDLIDLKNKGVVEE